jgi:NADPH:quinone reductase-like Zn-dependent oxidoreductase
MHGFGPPESLRYEEFPDSAPPRSSEVVVRIAAASVNPADWKLCAGQTRFTPAFPQIVGRDFAGVVIGAGSAVHDYRPGDRVYGFSELQWPGTWADLITIPAAWIAHAPKTITLTEAASLPVCALTAWVTLFEDFKLNHGDSILINGAAGGVGSVAVQLARNAGARVIGTASGRNLAYLRGLGCDQVIDYTKESVGEVLSAVDAVLDGVGGESLRRATAVVRRGGWVAAMSEAPDQAEAARLGITAAQTRGRVMEGLLARIAATVDHAKLKPTVTATHGMREAARALAIVKEGHTRGKIVLENPDVRA